MREKKIENWKSYLKFKGVPGPSFTNISPTHFDLLNNLSSLSFSLPVHPIGLLRGSEWSVYINT